MAGPFFFVDPADITADRATLRGDQAHHLAVVLRGAKGQPVEVADGRGAVYRARILRVEAGPRAGANAAVVELALDERRDTAVPVPRLTVVHALPKGRKLDDVVQRLSEVGVDRLAPVHSARSQVELVGERARKAHQRWCAVALAAAKQSRRPRVLEVDPVGWWGDAFAGLRAGGANGVVFWESATAGLSTAVEALRGAEEVVIGVGPEGGLTGQEVADAGLPPVTLGPTILRTETAALVGTVAVGVYLGRIA